MIPTVTVSIHLDPAAGIKLQQVFLMQLSSFTSETLMAQCVKIKYMRFSNIFFMFIASSLSSSCVHEFSCDEVTDDLLKKQASIVVEDIGPNGRIVHYSGVNIYNRSKSSFIDEGGMYFPMKDIVQIGDTLIKHKNQTEFLIRKKNVIVRFKFECIENQGYGFNIDTLKK